MAIYSSPRLLIVPGLHDSGAAHWQSWLQHQFRDAKRVVQRDFSQPDLARWSARISSTLDAAVGSSPDGEWIAVAHSFGCLALAHHLAEHPDSPIRQALFVAPAEPDKFGLAELLPHHRLHIPSTLIASQNDPWMSAASALRWASRWGASFTNLGAVGHINTESGFGPFPLAKRWVDSARAKAARERRPQHTSFQEWSFAV
ncbi:alpha/beta hydrolase [Paucibacter sp. B2R-40]|uniref:RBBP9/YdeN family alpha/beta hydrolase n=1 Tax=Paucibacter sp. B2R-40 TaxID=2893554 RepID=UPI0021E3DC70|nr:alpha/beta hydrolase [Paucibacter sp. B2R-40]MCV2355694.1 alpha/beta hydrolase [Paucibacter sp. B2R-40]